MHIIETDVLSHWNYLPSLGILGVNVKGCEEKRTFVLFRVEGEPSLRPIFVLLCLVPGASVPGASTLRLLYSLLSACLGDPPMALLRPILLLHGYFTPYRFNQVINTSIHPLLVSPFTRSLSQKSSIAY